MNAAPQRFNDDLLISQQDRELAAKTFGEVAHAVDFPELRELFVGFDMPANRAKRCRRAVGIVAIVLGAVALLGATLIHDKEQTDRLNLLAGACAAMGIASLLLGSFGTLAGQPKVRWLCSRLMTERLRQFHFQTLACRLPEVLRSMKDATARKEFALKRRAWLASFRLAYEGHLAARLREVLDDDAEENFWLHDEQACGGALDASDPRLPGIFAAYRLLRFEHQIQYANYRLGADEGLFSTSAARQLDVLRKVELLLILIIFLFNLALAVTLGFGTLLSKLLGALFGAATKLGTTGYDAIFTSSGAHTLIISLFVGIVAMRTLEEGLQPAREVERYMHYRSSMLSLLRRFDATSDPHEKVAIMRDAERASYQELRSFLRTHDDARYIL